jgi:hypothetical protein
MTTREERIGLNEAVFREVNERIEEVAEAFDLNEERIDLLCECGRAECVDRISMTRSEYEKLRSEPTHFAICPGHDEPDVERVIANGKGYDVVEKFVGIPQRVAEETDPRS